MNKRREPKKSETLEVRLPHAVKSALMEKAQAEGRSASDVVRESIGSYLADQTKESRSMLMTFWKPAAVLGSAALALVGSALAPTAAQAGPDFRAAFEKFDANKDGAVTLDEFSGGHADRLIVHSEMKAHGGPVMIPLLNGATPPQTGKPAPADLLKADFGKQDSNGNGAVDLAEFEAFHLMMMKTAFGSVDGNKDGAVDPAELSAVAARLPKGAPSLSFADLDRDRNGKLSEDEFFSHHR